MYGLTGFQHDPLYVTAGLDKPHRLAIKDQLEDYYETEIHHGRPYPSLDMLAEKGLLGKGKKDRRADAYAIVARGRREIETRDD